MSTSVLTKSQTRQYGPKTITYCGERCTLTAKIRYDDKCGNGHNTFAITGEIWKWRREIAGGCLHDEIAREFPELAPFIKWHLCSSDGPMHYVANTMYFVEEHGPNCAWVYYRGPNDPLGIADEKERLLAYMKSERAAMAEGIDGYRVVWDAKTVKIRNLDDARSSACWPDATDEDLTAPGLKERLEARLPDLLHDFQTAVESLGFTF